MITVLRVFVQNTAKLPDRAIDIPIIVRMVCQISMYMFSLPDGCSMIERFASPAILIVPQLGHLDRPVGRRFAIFFWNSVATHLTLVLAATHEATIEAGHTSPAGCSPFSLFCIASRALHGRACLETCVLRYFELLWQISVQRNIQHLPLRLAAELRYYYRIPVVVNRPSIFHISIVPGLDVLCKLSDSRISTAVYPVVGPSSNASSS